MNKEKKDQKLNTPSSDKSEKKVSEEQVQQRKKFFVYTLLGLIFCVAMWLIFAPSPMEEQESYQGFNTNVPLPIQAKLIDDKQAAYEQDLLKEKQDERRMQMQDLASMFEQDVEEPEEILQSKSGSLSSGIKQPKETVYASANAYQDMNRTLGTFYEQPKVDAEKEEMKKELAELRELLDERKSEKETIDDQFALLEKSYELAAKYMPQVEGKTGAESHADQRGELGVAGSPGEKNGKAIVESVGLIKEQVVSSLAQPTDNLVLRQSDIQARRLGFYSASDVKAEADKNTIAACIHGDQTITDGQSVRLRLMEPMRAGKIVIPKNTIVTGYGKIQGERLGISITTLEYNGSLIPVALMVADSDGQSGIFIPGSMEINAIKEVAANLGANLGTTISITNQSAGDQLLAELGKGAIQGTSQYISKKMRTVKVHLKEGYQLMLYQEKQ